MCSSDLYLYTWGNNSYSQLGLSDLTHRFSPVQVGTTNNWSQVCCGYYHTIASQSNGTLWSCGLNSWGVLGQSNTTNYSTLTQIGTSNNWSIIPTTMWQSTYAADTSGTLYSWGNNTFGQLGRIASTVYSPIQLSTTSNWNIVSAGTTHFLAIDNNNALWAQGNNSWGQLGTNDVTHRYSLTQIGTLTNWSNVACGDVFSVALKTDGTLWAWGNN